MSDANKTTTSLDTFHAVLGRIKKQDGATEDDLLQLANMISGLHDAMMDIAYCRIPDVPDGCTVGMDQYGEFAMKRAREVLGVS